jgi:hypothetical protein
MITNRVLNPPTLTSADGIYYVKTVDNVKDIYIVSSITGTKVITKVTDEVRWEDDNIIQTVEGYKWNTIDINLQHTGHRASNGAFSNLNYHGYFWTSNRYGDINVYVDKMVNRVRPIIKSGDIYQGCSVRLFRYCTTEERLLEDGHIFTNVYTDVQNNTYDGIKINIFILLLTNLKVTTYTDSTHINVINDNDLWKTDTDGALAIYPFTEEVFYNASAIAKDNFELYDYNNGWSIPSINDWNHIFNFLDGNIVETIDPNPTKIKPTNDKYIDAKYIINIPDYDGMYEPLDPAIQAHIVEIGNPHDTTAELVGAVRKNNPITANTHSIIQYDEKGLVVSGRDINTDDISDVNKGHKFVSQTQINDWDSKPTIEQIKADSEIDNLLTNTHAPHSDDQDLSGLQTINANSLTTTNKTIVEAINEVNAIVKGKSKGYVFNTKASLDIWLSNPTNKALLNNGDNLFIVALDTPDYWWDFADQIYHPLESEKVDLTGYVANSRTVNSKALTSDIVLTTDDIAESVTPTNKWWTNIRTISSVLTGFTANAGTVTNTDSILQAIQKIVGNISSKLTTPTETKTLLVETDKYVIKDSEDNNKYKEVLKSNVDEVWIGSTPPPTSNYNIWINPTVTQSYVFNSSTASTISPDMNVDTYKVNSNYNGGNTVTIGGYTNLPKIDCEKSVVIKNINSNSKTFVFNLSTIVVNSITYNFIPMNTSSITVPTNKYFDSSYKFVSIAESNGLPTEFNVLILFAIQE